MSAAAALVDAPPDASSIRAVAGLETRRLLRHPLFVVAVAAHVWFLFGSVVLDPEPNLQRISETWTVLTAFFLGLAGFLAMYRITRSTTGSLDMVAAAPVDEQKRTLALALACLVPVGLALLSGAFTLLAWEPGPITEPGFYGDLPRADTWLFNAGAVLAALGGPLLGVAVGRWWSWPMAGAVTAVALVAWCVSTGISTTSFATTLHHQAAPFTLPVTGASSEETFRQAGSWWWRIPYVVSLCGLALLAALLHGATGRRRSLLLRVGSATAVLAAVLLVVSASTGTDGVLLWRA